MKALSKTLWLLIVLLTGCDMFNDALDKLGKPPDQQQRPPQKPPGEQKPDTPKKPAAPKKPDTPKKPVAAAKSWKRVATSQIWPARHGHTSVVFQDKIWVLGGADGAERKNDVWSSHDGRTWVLEARGPWPARNEHTSVVFQNKIWILGGYDGSNHRNDVWSSSDGRTWKEVEDGNIWPARSKHGTVVFNGKIWVLGGTRNDLWSSSDGATWTKIHLHAPYSWNWRHIHQQHSMAVYRGVAWIIGGGIFSGLEYVWHTYYELDKWNSHVNYPHWKGRFGHSNVVYEDKLWVLGGAFSVNPDEATNEVWSGHANADKRDLYIRWKHENAPPWPARWNHTSVVFQDKIWILGGGVIAGFDHSNWEVLLTGYNDVWVYGE